MIYTGTITYKNNIINQLKVELNSIFDFSNTEPIETKFEPNNNILLNNYEGDVIDNIFANLRSRIIGNLEEKQSIINTKLLNNILLLIDEQEVARKNEEINNLELKKQKFNNKFVLYEGENIDIETITKLIQTAGKNMTDFEVVNGKQIKILIQSGVKNEEKAEQIINALSNQRYTYNVEMEYS